MKRAVIIGGGNITDYDYIGSQIRAFSGMIICADNGYNHAANMGLQVDLVAGDFDSCGVPGSINIIQYNTEKNHTDTELALLHARELGARDFLFVGVTGTRLDHTLANIHLLKGCSDRGESAVIINEHNKIALTQTSIEFTGETGGLVSLIPLSDCFGVTTQGLKYPLHNDVLKFGEGRGVSNVVQNEKAHISLSEGILLVISARD